MQCPQCNNDVPVSEAQFGALYTCPKCVAVYFVGFDGQPEYSSMESSFEPLPAHEENNFAEEFISTFEVSAFASVAQEISDYGNQEEVISNISYDLNIKGLDTIEVMQSFKDAIEDSKFAWLTQDILSQIKNGQATLQNLNPIQAFVLATRIQFLDLDIEWKQNVAF